MRVRTTLTLVTAAFSFLLAGASPGGDKRDAHPPAMPIYVTPFYDSTGTKVSVGEHSKQLADADAKTIVDVCTELEKEKAKLRAEVMYVAAIWLYDLGRKDEAVYWFYMAQYRARVFTAILDDQKVGTIGSEALELKQAYSSFNQLAGEYINGYAFGRLPKLEQTLSKVVEEGKVLPKFVQVYPDVKFIDEKVWASKNKDVSDGWAGLIDNIKTNADSTGKQRNENGVEGKY